MFQMTLIERVESMTSSNSVCPSPGHPLTWYVVPIDGNSDDMSAANDDGWASKLFAHSLSACS